jgi:soluble lytic murein transglycosylase-like protein
MGRSGSSTWTLLAAACLAASAAHAQADVSPDQRKIDAATSSTDGAQIVEGRDGFQLVEHGLWERPTSLYMDPGEGAAGGGNPSPPTASQRSRAQIFNFRRAVYLPHIIAAEAKYALPAGLLDAVIFAESRYNPLAISGTGAVGLGQLMPSTAREIGVRNRFDPLENLDGAARYLRSMLDRFGMVHLALAAYNAGPRAVERARGIPQNLETPAYVREVLQRWRF